MVNPRLVKMRLGEGSYHLHCCSTPRKEKVVCEEGGKKGKKLRDQRMKVGANFLW